jgi:hypothetical protein
MVQTMDDFLDKSEALHIDIISTLEGLAPYPSMRHEVGMAACGLAFEHGLSLRLLIRAQCYTSALTMMRLQYEALTRAIWLVYAATDKQVETISAPLTAEAERKAKNLPMLSQMLDQIAERAPAQAARMLMNFKDVNYHAVNSFVHSGIHPLRRHAQGYPATLIQSAIQNSNGLNLMTLQTGVILTGDTRLAGTLSAMQEKHREVLPAQNAQGEINPPL